MIIRFYEKKKKMRKIVRMTVDLWKMNADVDNSFILVKMDQPLEVKFRDKNWEKRRLGRNAKDTRA